MAKKRIVAQPNRPTLSSVTVQRNATGWHIVGQVGGLFLLMFYLGGALSILLTFLRLHNLDRWVTDSGLFLLLFIPIVYRLDPEVFSKAHWHFPVRASIGICTVIFLQFVIEQVAPRNINYDNYELIAALIFFPTIEEIVRATMFELLKKRVTVVSAIIVVSFLFALCHASFWVAFAQCVLLAVIFLWTGGSIPAAMAAHFAMNLFAVRNALERLVA